MTRAELDEQIAALEEVKFSGALSLTSDGTVTTYRSMDDLDRALRTLYVRRNRLNGVDEPSATFNSFGGCE